MNTKIFFSWQADTETKIGRNFLLKTLEKSCTKITNESELYEAQRSFEVDSDTKGVSGQPPIVDTIFKKIDESDIYVADLTFVARRLDERLSPNPNVLIEYGWALKSKGHSSIITIMNTAYGKPEETNMPFNMKHVRWPITYHLPNESSEEEIKKTRENLATTISKAISLILRNVPTKEDVLDSGNVDIARFCEPSKSIGYSEGNWGGDEQEIFLTEGSEMWLRVIPETKFTEEWSITKIKKLFWTDGGKLPPLYSGRGGWSHFISEDGAGTYYGPGTDHKSKQIDATGCVMVFRTGEIWAIDLDYLGLENNLLHQYEIERSFILSLTKYSSILKEMGATGNFRWIAGLKNIKGRRLNYPPPPKQSWIGKGPLCLTNEITATGLHKDGESPTKSLLPFFNKIFEKCGRERPDYLPQP